MWIVRAVPFAFVLGLAACGGSETEVLPSPPPAVNPQGIWTGSLSTGADLSVVITDDNVLWGVYAEVGGARVGLVHADQVAMNGSTLTATLRDYQYGNTVSTLDVTGTVAERSSMEVRSVQPGQVGNASLRYDSSYYTPATTILLEGQWTGSDRDGNVTTVEITALGALRGATVATSGTCTFRGNLAPVAGRGYYVLNITFDPVNTCLLPGQHIGGIAGISGAGTARQLVAGGITDNGSQGGAMILTPVPPPEPTPAAPTSTTP
ncbi:hypothetical protein FOZ76_02550 [Verticiella sediminum]|uniref:Uncharacterized protein n=1 Tax=Verticiella sediminum TaxID=1247510 RepID=A0A556B0C4_9BURK|nr:hypothetical protein [Verticiella sediminum]TSH98648.1 hypothetical protein FOZ76_02550 [Verticiella sediminum]